nr:uncharacterized protein LOC110137829 [Odocoileus virginianus texanus]
MCPTVGPPLVPGDKASSRAFSVTSTPILRTWRTAQRTAMKTQEVPPSPSEPTTPPRKCRNSGCSLGVLRCRSTLSFLDNGVRIGTSLQPESFCLNLPGSGNPLGCSKLTSLFFQECRCIPRAIVSRKGNYRNQWRSHRSAAPTPPPASSPPPLCSWN